MKRLMPSSLITFLQSPAGQNCLRADLFVITLPTGAVIYATDGQLDITLPASTPGWAPGTQQTFSAAQYGRWSRGAITSEAAFTPKANTMALTCIAQQNVAYPGRSLGILKGALLGLFDAAQVQVLTAYMPLGRYGDVSNGLEMKWAGTVSKILDIGRTKVDFECADAFYWLNQKVPTRLIQTNCPWAFADSNCGLTAANYTQALTAASGCTVWTVTPTSLTEPDGYFTQGVIKCLTGQNAGLAQTVRKHASGVLSMLNPWLFAPAAGDTFAVIKGCDKSLQTCAATKTTSGSATDNRIHYGGAPFVPPPTAVF